MKTKTKRATETPWWQDPLSLSEQQWQPHPAGTLNGKQRGYLKQLAHSLKPVVQIGQEGITDRIVGETRKQLIVHELVKVKWIGLSKEDGSKKEQAREFARVVGAHFVQLLGQNILLYRRLDPSVPPFKGYSPIQLPA